MHHLKKLLLLVLFVLPASDNYSLHTYGFGSGGAANTASDNYSINAVTGQVSGTGLDSNNYTTLPGLISTQLANTPGAPTFTNENMDINKLKLVLDTANNPNDAEFAIAISDDNWVTTEYVQDDNTVGATLGLEDWQTYSEWGGASGEFITGLDPDTEYKVKVKARHGDFTEGPWGPEATESTDALHISFDLDVAASDTETTAPYQVSVGTLTPGTVVTATEKVWVDIHSNADYGAYVYVAGLNEGLHSSVLGHTISAVSSNLAGQSEGFGLRVDTVAETMGGPLVAVSPYDGTNDIVGGPGTVLSQIFSTSGSKITDGRGSLLVKAKVQNITPAASDYSEVLTLVATAVF